MLSSLSVITCASRLRRRWTVSVALLAIAFGSFVAWAELKGTPIVVNSTKLADRALVQGGQPYLPLTAVRQIPGVASARWDGQQVRIETRGGRPTPGAYLADMEPVARSPYPSMSISGGKLNGRSYPKSLCGHAGDSTKFLEYDLSRKYTSLEAVLGIDDRSENANATMIFEVFGDGGSLFRSDPVRLGREQPIRISVAGILRLRVAITGGDDESYNATAVFGDARVR